MKNFTKILLTPLLTVLIIAGCGIRTDKDSSHHTEVIDEEMALEVISESEESKSASETSSDKAAKSNDDNDTQSRPGTITAGEWNDLDNWTFWKKITDREEFKHFSNYWTFYTFERVSVNVSTKEQTPVINAVVKLIRNEAVISTVRTDNRGNAELWIGLSQQDTNINYANLQLEVDGKKISNPVKSYIEGINRIALPTKNVENKIEVAFVVDATGSMSDELEYLKTELVDVIGKVKDNKPDMTVRTSAVFYRDQGDEYVTKISNFVEDVKATNNFIRKQSADGGGDYPEAVHTALEKAMGELQWSSNARTRIMFLLLDAPPHYQQDVLLSLHNSIEKAMEKGIKIIPIVASGINKETEFLMRFFAISTNGTYVFITDHSGVGNSHIEASVGEYQVEYLNNLMVRLINKYAE